MIPCTEFIPFYSAFFTFLEERRGFAEVERFWERLFRPDGKGIPLVNFVERAGLRGCYEYWSHSLNEEAADFTMLLNEKRGFFKLKMHRCPSKGRLLEQQKKTGLAPYKNYCLHCDYYRAAVEKHGLKYVYDFTDTDRAACAILIYDPAVFDGRVIADADTVVMERSAAQNEYFHRDFHHSVNRCLHYLGEAYGDGEVRALFTEYVRTVQASLLREIREKGLSPLNGFILAAYEKEKAPEAVETALSETALSVRVRYCPAVRYLKERGHEVSPWFPKSTEYLMAAIAAECGLGFTMEAYDPAEGAALYGFRRGSK